MSQLEVASLLGDFLDPIFSAVLRLLLRIVGCQIECDEGEGTVRVIALIGILILISTIVYARLFRQK
ncbi:hypothetical protein BTA51_27640 [Hahella sp. CCB-MM4]|nr:hypothetical protein BTA51_27640 [Hahella sp. CCB-MM4]